MSMHLQDYCYSWYFVLFHLSILETLTQAHACVGPAGRLSDALHENIRSNFDLFVVTTISHYFILFVLKRSHMHMPAGVHWSPINQ